jgi:hypothetical protein
MSRATTLTQSEIDEILSFHCISNFPAPFLSLSPFFQLLCPMSPKSRKSRCPELTSRKKGGKKKDIYTCIRGKPLLHGKVFHLHRSTFLLILLLRPDFITEL